MGSTWEIKFWWSAMSGCLVLSLLWMRMMGNRRGLCLTHRREDDLDQVGVPFRCISNESHEQLGGGMKGKGDEKQRRHRSMMRDVEMTR
ncbi:hypothetical protein B0T20DRAFT_175322 [Sordaria brevicollis]|uniref:Uncharacterized protein n=1 Tax=Sordaria brevicollis TaxID=83679 RepID=A0AAE0PHK9_SORBR|nr:hypothetical protein B0T20DRAFT_175322 [Sordaria brevicollis]